jgi:WD40 repeat protein
MKPLMDVHAVGDEKVTAMDINEEGGYLLCGYNDGGIALWDLLEYKLLKYLPQMH